MKTFILNYINNNMDSIRNGIHEVVNTDIIILLNNMEYINDQKLVDFFNEVVQSFDDNMSVVLDVISNPGGDIDE